MAGLAKWERLKLEKKVLGLAPSPAKHLCVQHVYTASMSSACHLLATLLQQEVGRLTGKSGMQGASTQLVEGWL